MASGRVQSVSAQARSTTRSSGAGRPSEAPAGPSPSGRRPIGSGAPRWNRAFSGTITTTIAAATASAALRQPQLSTPHCISGSRVTPATPTPEKASPMASPRLRTNQLGRNMEWAM